MKIVLSVFLGVLVLATAAGLLFLRGALATGSQRPDETADGALWDLASTTLEGTPVSLDTWRGQVVLVVNVASKCGLTPQYSGLEALYRELREQGFVILGVPSNDFMGQEPGTSAEIREFCSTNYDVTFPLLAKTRVKGEAKDELYRWLTAGGVEEPTWNFTKYLIGRDGRLVARFAPRTAPDDPALRRAIAAALAAPRPDDNLAR